MLLNMNILFCIVADLFWKLVSKLQNHTFLNSQKEHFEKQGFTFYLAQ